MKTLRHSEQTLKTALISKSPELVSQYERFSASERRLMNEAFQPSGTLFEPITLHSESDWIASHPENPQDFEQFFNDPKRKIPSTEKHTIYIQSIGDILKFLKRKKPGNAFCVVGITMIDLYPRDSWNFVFGQASLTDGVGIFSFARYGSDFYSSHYGGKVKKLEKSSSCEYSVFDNYYIPEITSILLLRSCKTLAHEIGHIFGMRHCQWLSCLMQGSNHMDEADRRPPYLCPICLRKLQCAIGFSITERYKALLRWLDEESTGLPRVMPKPSREDSVHLPDRVDAFREWKEWITKCLALLQK
ncbi:PREDICTED: archaemetzincin-2 isoform X2 [Elephantulus edwardii]|uniref:archaemetzincin-2 isoform X2 n=1 Tax=Elephantulus edwardii TaxID=28737 RepID=UPI0003F0CB47|nr:PREDICTED: archaemetzincin-2 isoform X2 [Elephantulus edwardii]